VTEVRVVQPGYFGTMRIPLLRGRFFTEADNRTGAPRGFVVNQTLVRQMFGNADPLGQRLTVGMGDDHPGQIIGVVGDTKYTSLDAEIHPMVYYVQVQLPISFGSFVLRTSGPPEQMALPLEAAIHELKKDQPVSDIRTMDDWIGLSIRPHALPGGALRRVRPDCHAAGGHRRLRRDGLLGRAAHP